MKFTIITDLLICLKMSYQIQEKRDGKFYFMRLDINFK